MTALLDRVLPILTLATAAVVVVAAAIVLARRPRRADEIAMAFPGAAKDFEDFSAFVRQLDAEDVTLRLLAVRQLEELAQAYRSFRQDVVDVLCSYLRRPPSDHDGMVRRVAQQTLISHLIPSAGERYWGAANVDLGGAVLTDLDLSDAVVGTLACGHALFQGETIVRRARILGRATFTGASFVGPVRSDDVDFEQVADFTAARMCSEASFGRCTFRGDVTFAAASIAGSANFAGAVFLAGAFFSHPIDGPTRFGDFVDFRSACFAAGHFRNVEFPAGVDLSGANFTRPVGEGVAPAVRDAVREAHARRSHASMPARSRR